MRLLFPQFWKRIFFFFFGCVGSSLLRIGLSLVAASRGYSSMWCTGFSLWWLLLLQSTGSRRVRFSSCGSRALQRRLGSCGSRAGLVSPRHVESSRTRARTGVPCIGRQILNHCATRERILISLSPLLSWVCLDFKFRYSSFLVINHLRFSFPIIYFVICCVFNSMVYFYVLGLKFPTTKLQYILHTAVQMRTTYTPIARADIYTQTTKMYSFSDTSSLHVCSTNRDCSTWHVTGAQKIFIGRI